jgi:hypothetical protein
MRNKNADLLCAVIAENNALLQRAHDAEAARDAALALLKKSRLLLQCCINLLSKGVVRDQVVAFLEDSG